MFGKPLSWAKKKVTKIFRNILMPLWRKLIGDQNIIEEIQNLPGVGEPDFFDTVTVTYDDEQVEQVKVIQRIRELPGNQTPEWYNNKLIEILSKAGRVRETLNVGSTYVYVYQARTRKKWYDRHPVTTITHMHKWGFSGYAFHWDQIRNYKLGDGRILSRFYYVKPGEIDAVLSIPMARFYYIH